MPHTVLDPSGLRCIGQYTCPGYAPSPEGETNMQADNSKTVGKILT